VTKKNKLPNIGTRAYASLNGLSNWYADLLLRIKELESWTADFSLPTSVWLSGATPFFFVTDVGAK
jgi:hypothetical protein